MKSSFHFLAPIVQPFRWNLNFQIHNASHNKKHFQKLQESVLRQNLQVIECSQLSKDLKLPANPTISDMKSLSAFDYAFFKPYIDQSINGHHTAMFAPQHKPVYIAMSSGTTGHPKRIPLTHRQAKQIQQHWHRWGTALFTDHPQLLLGKIALLSAVEKMSVTPSGISCGDVSGFIRNQQPVYIRIMYSLPDSIIQIKQEWLRYHMISLHLLATGHLRAIFAASPASILRVLANIQDNFETYLQVYRDQAFPSAWKDAATDHEHNQKFHLPSKSWSRYKKIKNLDPSHTQKFFSALWPHLDQICCWRSGSMQHLVELISQQLPRTRLRDVGLCASEGIMNLIIQDHNSAGLLNIWDNFYLFVHESELTSNSKTYLCPHELEVGERYFIVLTNGSGLINYQTYDLIEVAGYHGAIPMITFIRRAQAFYDLTGEKLTEPQISQALSQAFQIQKFALQRCILQPITHVFPPYYACLIEKSLINNPQIKNFAQILDQQLCGLNIIYKEHREAGKLGPIQLQAISGQEWEAILANSTARLEQRKPRLIYLERHT